MAVAGSAQGSPELAAARDGQLAVDRVQVRYLGVIHDFVMLDALHDTPPARAAVAQAVAVLEAAFAA